MDASEGVLMTFNKSRVLSAAAKGFYAHRAAAGKKIKKKSVFNGILKNVKDRFAEHGGCRAGLRALLSFWGGLKKTAAEFTAEYA